MTRQQNEPQRADDTVPAFVRCEHCERVWPRGCEQAVAIRKRGKCICCIVKLGERIEMDPYEFPAEIDYTPNTEAQGRPPLGEAVP